MKLQDKIHAVMDKLSNNEGDTLEIDDAWIEKAGEDLKASLRRQFTRREDGFRLRASNMGKSLCQLQMAKSGAVAERKDYNFIMRMLHGDAIEVIMDLVLKIAKANITGGKSKISLDLGHTVINGEDDVHIDNKVYDVKSSSPYGFDRKWMSGLDALKSDDPFGYIGQLVGYSVAQNLDTGGWIVVCKSTGQVVVVDADFSKAEKDKVIADIEMKAIALNEDWSFERCFEPVDDFFNKKFTGSKKLAMNCNFCDYKTSCWPKAQYLPQPRSKAKEPKKAWYVQYEGLEF